jgi:hypothetical protein
LGLGLISAQAHDLPLFNAHFRDSEPDWEALSPAQVLAIPDQAGVRRTLVSSTPDDGTLKLYEHAPQRIVLFPKPYRTRQDLANWHSDPAVQTYIEERLKRLIYKGIGEFHLSATHVERRWSNGSLSSPLIDQGLMTGET